MYLFQQIEKGAFQFILWITLIPKPNSVQRKKSTDQCPSWYRCTVKAKVAQSCPTLWDPMDYTLHGILQARILEWVASPFFRGIFPTEGSNPGLLHCRQILYQLSHQESPWILEWVAYPFSSGSPRPRNQTGVSGLIGFFTNWAMREALLNKILTNRH